MTATRHSLRVVATAAIALVMHAAMVSAQEPRVCDRTVHALDIPLGYKWRGDRCEGVFAQQVAGEALAVRSFTRGTPAFDAERSDSVRLTWPAPATGTVRLRVRGYSLDPLYGMDAMPAGVATFNWATAILGQLRYRSDEVGFLAWAPVAEQGVERRLYLPLSVGPVDTAKATYRIAVVGVSTLARGSWTTLPVVDGKPSLEQATSGSIQGRFPPHEPVMLDVAPRGAPGTYRLEITARGTDGRVFSSPVVYFLHAGS